MKWGLLRTWWDALPRGLETVKQRFQCGLPEGREQDTWADPQGRSGCDFWTIISTCEAFWRNLFARNQAKRALSSVASLLTLPTKHVLFLSVT